MDDSISIYRDIKKFSILIKVGFSFNLKDVKRLIVAKVMRGGAVVSINQ